MLLSYSFSNFQSFRELTHVSTTVSDKVALSDWITTTPTGERINKVVAVMGANGSGKTTLLKPLVFLDWFISHSFSQAPEAAIPFTPHFATTNEATEFSATAIYKGQIWKYVLRCIPERVIHEALYVKKERFKYVFVRDWDDNKQTYRIKQQDFGFAPAEARKVRANASLISTAAQYGIPLAKDMASSGLRSNITALGRQPLSQDLVLNAAAHFSQLSEQRTIMARLLHDWDLGLSNVELEEISVAQPDGSNNKIWLPVGIHQTTSGPRRLNFLLESSGTQAAMVLLSHLLPALQNGGIAVIDEFENDLHPHMLEPILGLFASPLTNPHNAQLLFTCHSAEVLNLLHKSQIMLVEKDENCESTAWRLDEMEGVRNDDNFYAKYMAGAYGAVPHL